MLASLIPFFIVARLGADDSAWIHGPEYVFNVEIKLTSTPMSHDGVQSSNYTSADLLCRPTESDTLNCHLSNVKKQSTDVTNGNEIDVLPEVLRFEITEEPFEIQFSDRGIAYLIVDEEICTLKLNYLKNIVELLAIGADLNGIPDGTFESEENSTVGYCNVTFTVRHSPCEGMICEPQNSLYELECLPSLNKVPGEKLVIKKAWNLDNCSCYADFYHGTFGESTVVDTEVPTHLMTFVSFIFISDTRFVASATKKGSTGSHETEDYFSIAEDITVSLKDVRPAKGEVVAIPRASKTTIVGNSKVDRISPST